MASAVFKAAETRDHFKGREKCYVRYYDIIIFGLKDYHSNDDHLRLSRQCLRCCLSAVCFWSCELALALVCSCVQPLVEVTIRTHKQEQSRNLTFIYLPGLTEVIPFRLHIPFPKRSLHPNCVWLFKGGVTTELSDYANTKPLLFLLLILVCVALCHNSSSWWK